MDRYLNFVLYFCGDKNVYPWCEPYFKLVLLVVYLSLSIITGCANAFLVSCPYFLLQNWPICRPYHACLYCIWRHYIHSMNTSGLHHPSLWFRTFETLCSFLNVRRRSLYHYGKARLQFATGGGSQIRKVNAKWLTDTNSRQRVAF
jgi:hypothetical protein